LSLALGDRAEKEAIRHGATDAHVEAIFSVEAMSAQFKKDFADFIKDEKIVIQRDISRDGNSRARVNGVLTSLARLKEVTSPIAEILGQHANQMLMNESNHLAFLDRFAQVETFREETAAAFHDWDRSETELRDVLKRRQQLSDERELLLFQRNEIEKAGVTAGEEEQLTTERKILESARALMISAETIQNALDGEESSAIRQLRHARKEAEKMAAIDPYLEKSASQLAEADFLLEDLRRTFEQYGSSIHDDPIRLDQIHERLDELYHLKKKYGGSEESILAYLRDLTERLENRPDTDKLIDYLEKESNRLKKVYAEKAVALSEVRQKGAAYLEKLVVKELAGLAIEQGKFACEFVYEADVDGVALDTRIVKPYPHGLENCRFLFSANAGEPLKALVKTASGGEISRVLLAIKAAEKRNNKLSHSLLVFDEVDTGIGGQTALEVGKKLAKISEETQVIVVTHLHQIARLANHHYLAEKETGRLGRSLIVVNKLDPKGIKIELDRMIALPQETLL